MPDACHLHIASTELRLLAVADGRLLVAWPFTCLRRYMSTKGCFTIEAGRRAPTGEGRFSFATPQHDEVYKILDTVIKAIRAGKPTETHEKLTKTESCPSIDTSSHPTDNTENGYHHLIASPCPPLQAHSPHPHYDQAMNKTTSVKDESSPYSSPYGHFQAPDRGTVGGQGIPVTVGGDSEEKYDTLGPSFASHSNTALQEKLGHIQGNESHQFTQSSGDAYNVLDHSQSPGAPISLHHFTSPPVSNEVDDTYNVIGDAVKTPMAEVAKGHAETDFYNTLDLGKSPPLVGKPPMPAVAKGDVETDFYNTLDLGKSPPSVGKPPMPAVAKGDAETDFYNTLDLGKSPPLVGKPPVSAKDIMPLQQAPTPDADLYNTLDVATGAKPSLHLPQLQDTYNTLDHTQSPKQPILPARGTKPSADTTNSPKKKAPVKPPKPPVHKRIEQPQDDSYTVLGPGNLTASSGAECDNTYNTLDHTAASSPTQVDSQKCPLQRSGNQDVPTASDKRLTPSRHSMPNVRCPLDGILDPSESEVSLDQVDLDSYASIDYTVVSAAKSPLRAPPVPTARARPPTQPAPILPKSRKASAPDILAFHSHSDHGEQSLKSPKKGARSNLVSNLRASLEAGGLDLSKPRWKPQKPSREDSVPESDLYAEVDEQACRDSAISGPTPIKAGRSPLAPIEQVYTEDIYEDPDQATRPKSWQLAKSKPSHRK